MKQIFTLLFSLSSMILLAQSQFSEVYNSGGYMGRIWGLDEKTDSSYVIAGNYSLAEISAEGNLNWMKGYRDSSWAETYYYGVLTTLDGGSLITGYTRAFGNGSKDMLILKTDLFGEIEWSLVLGEDNNDMAYEALQLSDSSYIVCGGYALSPSSFTKASVFRIDKAGNLMWGKYAEDGGIDNFIRVIKTSDDMLYLCGNHGGRAQVARMDLDGNVLWGKVIAPNWCNIARGIAEAPNKGVFVASNSEYVGLGSSSNSTPDLVIYQLDSLGNIVWNKFYGNIGREYAEAALFDESDSTYVVVFDEDTSSTPGTMANYGLAKFDLNGDLVWSRTYGDSGYDYPRMVRKTADGSFLLGGESTSFGGVKPFLVKTDNNGAGSGCYEDNMTFDTTGVAPTIFIDSSYAFSTLIPQIIPSNLFTFDITADDSLFCYGCDSVSAQFSYTINNDEVSFMDSSANAVKYYWEFGDGNFSTIKNPVHTYSLDGDYTVCLTTFNSCSSDSSCQMFNILITGINESLKNKVNIYPNPTNGMFTVDIANSNTFVHYKILSIEGRIIEQGKTAENKIMLDLSRESQGVYFLHVQDENSSKVYKILKQ
ncbi:MAG: T9SS type A sorting domain-containing protein [Flavobacteriales bacterium]|nr:T9SS type A sorting domain-containing protein [Flavobacteriales bacterium]